jgi:hypothetical protein
VNSSGYKSAPLSDEMERRIEERITSVRSMPAKNMWDILVRDFQRSTLEWVLREAEALKSEVIFCGIRRV